VTIGPEERDVTDQLLIEQFHQAMVDVYHDAKRLAHYNATYFYRMVLDDGGHEAARRLLTSAQISTGLAELWRKGRLDISMESLVLQPRFDTLFTDEEREIARRRLADLGYTAQR
jgi:hypothetical protein